MQAGEYHTHMAHLGWLVAAGRIGFRGRWNGLGTEWAAGNVKGMCLIPLRTEAWSVGDRSSPAQQWFATLSPTQRRQGAPRQARLGRVGIQPTDSHRIP